MLQFIYINRIIKKVRINRRQTEFLTFFIWNPIKEKDKSIKVFNREFFIIFYSVILSYSIMSDKII